MHHALEIQEILSDIFVGLPFLWGYSRKKATSDLAALSRTCRAFKEPALDALWKVLFDLSPLARCLPEASHKGSSGDTVRYFQVFSVLCLLNILHSIAPFMNKYSFSRPLTQTEWGTLQSYTRRIQHILDFDRGLDWESVESFLTPLPMAPLFPNLRCLSCEYTEKTISLLRSPLPSLTRLYVYFQNQKNFQNPPESFPRFSPDIRILSIQIRHQDGFSKIESNYFSRWQNLSTLVCPQVALDMDNIVHLSRMPLLKELESALCGTLTASGAQPVFPSLRFLTLRPDSLDPVSLLLSQTRLPAVTELIVWIGKCPTRQELTSFFAAFQTSGACRTTGRLQLLQPRSHFTRSLRSERLLVCFDDLRPCMACSNLYCIKLNIECSVDLTEGQVLALASAWPKLKHFSINPEWGWATTNSGISPDGLVRLMETCPLLDRISLRLDTHGYTDVSPGRGPENLGTTVGPDLVMDVVDSVIEKEAVEAVSEFFCGISARCKRRFSLHAWSGVPMMDFPRKDECLDRWIDVARRVDDEHRERLMIGTVSYDSTFAGAPALGGFVNTIR